MGYNENTGEVSLSMESEAETLGNYESPVYIEKYEVSCSGLDRLVERQKIIPNEHSDNEDNDRLVIEVETNKEVVDYVKIYVEDKDEGKILSSYKGKSHYCN
jgi:hypothetical protein